MAPVAPACRRIGYAALLLVLGAFLSAMPLATATTSRTQGAAEGSALHDQSSGNSESLAFAWEESKDGSNDSPLFDDGLEASPFHVPPSKVAIRTLHPDEKVTIHLVCSLLFAMHSERLKGILTLISLRSNWDELTTLDGCFQAFAQSCSALPAEMVHDVLTDWSVPRSQHASKGEAADANGAALTPAERMEKLFSIGCAQRIVDWHLVTLRDVTQVVPLHSRSDDVHSPSAPSESKLLPHCAAGDAIHLWEIVNWPNFPPETLAALLERQQAYARLPSPPPPSAAEGLLNLLEGGHHALPRYNNDAQQSSGRRAEGIFIDLNLQNWLIFDSGVLNFVSSLGASTGPCARLPLAMATALVQMARTVAEDNPMLVVWALRAKAFLSYMMSREETFDAEAYAKVVEPLERAYSLVISRQPAKVSLEVFLSVIASFPDEHLRIALTIDFVYEMDLAFEEFSASTGIIEAVIGRVEKEMATYVQAASEALDEHAGMPAVPIIALQWSSRLLASPDDRMSAYGRLAAERISQAIGDNELLRSRLIAELVARASSLTPIALALAIKKEDLLQAGLFYAPLFRPMVTNANASPAASSLMMRLRPTLDMYVGGNDRSFKRSFLLSQTIDYIFAPASQEAPLGGGEGLVHEKLKYLLDPDTRIKVDGACDQGGPSCFWISEMLAHVFEGELVMPNSKDDVVHKKFSMVIDRSVGFFLGVMSIKAMQRRITFPERIDPDFWALLLASPILTRTEDWAGWDGEESPQRSAIEAYYDAKYNDEWHTFLKLNMLMGTRSMADLSQTLIDETRFPAPQHLTFMSLLTASNLCDVGSGNDHLRPEGASMTTLEGVQSLHAELRGRAREEFVHFVHAFYRGLSLAFRMDCLRFLTQAHLFPLLLDQQSIDAEEMIDAIEFEGAHEKMVDSLIDGAKISVRNVIACFIRALPKPCMYKLISLWAGAGNIDVTGDNRLLVSVFEPDARTLRLGPRFLTPPEAVQPCSPSESKGSDYDLCAAAFASSRWRNSSTGHVESCGEAVIDSKVSPLVVPRNACDSATTSNDTAMMGNDFKEGAASPLTTPQRRRSYSWNGSPLGMRSSAARTSSATELDPIPDNGSPGGQSWKGSGFQPMRRRNTIATPKSSASEAPSTGVDILVTEEIYRKVFARAAEQERLIVGPTLPSPSTTPVKGAYPPNIYDGPFVKPYYASCYKKLDIAATSSGEILKSLLYSLNVSTRLFDDGLQDHLPPAPPLGASNEAAVSVEEEAASFGGTASISHNGEQSARPRGGSPPAI